MSIVVAYAAILATSPAIDVGAFAKIFGLWLAVCVRLMIIFCALWLLIRLRGMRRVDANARPSTLLTEILASEWRRNRLVPIVLAPILFALTLTSFTAFKQKILPTAGFGLDFAFGEIDRMLFFGMDPWRITHAIVPGHWGTLFLDYLYAGWITLVVGGVLLSPWYHSVLRRRYLLTFVAIFVIQGTLLAYMLPAAGPCYYQHFHGSSEYAELMSRLYAQASLLGGREGLMALSGQEMLLSGHRGDDSWFAGGISAMPSLHNALAVLLACLGFNVHRRLGWILAVYAGLIWIASIHLGWHYAIDGIVGAAVTMLIWRSTAADQRFSNLNAVGNEPQKLPA